jgi:hypothetical protein
MRSHARCGGAIRPGEALARAPPDDKKTCAAHDERCATAAGCCDSADYCINNFCALVELL